MQITILHAVPPIVLFLAKHPLVSKFDLSSIKYMVSGAAPLGEGLTLECQDRLGFPIYQGTVSPYHLHLLLPWVSEQTGLFHLSKYGYLRTVVIHIHYYCGCQNKLGFPMYQAQYLPILVVCIHCYSGC